LSSYPDVEGDGVSHSVTVTVTRVGGTAGEVTVDWDITGGTATGGTDYDNALTGATLTFLDGNADPQTFDITIFEDTDVEGDEDIVLTLSGETGGATLGLSTATITITTDDVAPTITSAAPPNGDTTFSYSHTFTADGIPAPTFSVTGGALPPGLSLDGATGVLSGDPTTVGTYADIEVTATNGRTPDDTQVFTIDIVYQPWSYHAWTGDADSGIDGTYTYTVAQCFGDGDVHATVTVNGVTFQESRDRSGTGWDVAGIPTNWGGDDGTNLTGASEDLADEFIYGGNPGTVTLSGLTVGEDYVASFFSVAWEDGTRISTFSSDGNDLTFNQDEYGNNNGIVISYEYTATAATQVFTNDSAGFHLYALANRTANPPPVVTLDAPTEGQSFASGVTPITLTATATDDSAIDNVEFFYQGGASPWTPANITTALWLDAAEASTIHEDTTPGFVSQWDDKSGNGNDVTQVTGSLQPATGTRTLNGMNVLDFAADWLEVDPFAKSEPFTVFMVATVDVAAQASYVMWGDANNNNPYPMLYEYSDVYQIYGGGSQPNRPSDTNPHVFGVNYYSSALNVYVDGTGGTPAATTATALTGLQIGARNDSAGDSLDGMVAEFVLVDGTMSDADREKMEGYLAHKWGIALEAGHPYESVAPTGAGAPVSIGVDNVLGDDTYSVDWVAPPDGEHTLTAVATDDEGATTESAPINIIVGSVVTIEKTVDAAEPDTDGRFTLTRLGDASLAIDVNITVAGSATPDVDYTALPATVHFNATDTTATLNVPVLDDAHSDLGETVEVTVVAGTDYLPGATTTATVTIIDNDTPPPAAYFEWDAALDAGGDTTWPSTTANVYTWTFDGGNQTPVDVSGGRFLNVAQAYDFPAAIDEGAANWDGLGSTEPASWEFVIDIDADDGVLFESGGTGDGIRFDMFGGDIRGTIAEGTDVFVSYTPSAEEKADFLHVVFVADNVGNVFQLYVDGVLQDSAVWDAGDDWSGTDGAALGGHTGTTPDGANSGDFTGKLSIFRYYRNDALDAAQIALLYNLLGPNQAPAVALDAPTEGQVFTSGVTPITLTATATDDSAVTQVEFFYLDESAVGPPVPTTRNWDFETGNLTGWTVIPATVGTDQLFRNGNSPISNVRINPVQGSWYVDGFRTVNAGDSDAHTGIIESESFVLGANGRLTALTGGGSDTWSGTPAAPAAISGLALEREVTPGVWENVVFLTGGSNSLIGHDVDISAYEGDTVRLRLYDNDTGGWGWTAADDIEITHDVASSGEFVSIGVDSDNADSTYSVDWANPDDGEHTLMAVATDDEGATTESAQVNIVVGAVINIEKTTDAIEGAPGTDGLFTLTRLGDASLAIDVNIAVAGSATPGFDYTALPATVHFNATDTTATLPVPVLDDGDSDADETVVVTIQTGAGYLPCATPTATVTIADDDTPLPLTIPDCELWYDAADAATITKDASNLVSVWADKSGNGYDLSEATGSLQPTYNATALNGKGGVNFYLNKDLDSSATPTVAFVITVIKAENTVWNQYHAMLDSTTRIGGLRQSGDTGFHNNVYPSAAWDNGSSVTVSTTGFDSIDTPHIIGFTVAAGRGNPMPNITVGCYDAGASGGSGYQYEIIAYSSVPSEADRQALEGYLANKWGLGDSLPDGHPGKNPPPTVQLDAPAEGAEFSSGVASIALEATAGDDSAVTGVIFRANGAFIGTGSYTDPTWDFSWTDPDDGEYVLTAVATDDEGATKESDPKNIVVGSVISITKMADGAEGSPVTDGQFMLTRSGDTSLAIDVNITVAGTATPGPDYTALPATVHFGIDDTTATLDVLVIDDAEGDGDETVIVTIMAGTDYVPGSTPTATVTIVDDDALPPSTLTGLVLWYDAADYSTITETGGRVEEWRDKSGNNFHATQANTSYQPHYLANDPMYSGMPSVGTGGLQARMMNVPFTSSQRIYMVLYFGSGADETFPEHSSFLNADFRLVGRTGGNQWDSADLWATAGIYRDGSTTSNSVNLPMPATLWKMDSSDMRHQTAVMLCGHTGWGRWSGALGEIIFTDGTEDLAKQQEIETYLAYKWFIEEQLPETHPGYNPAPNVTLNTPTDTQEFVAGVPTIDFSATATDNGAVMALEFHVDGAKVGDGVFTGPTWDFTWVPPADHSYVVTAVATDNRGKVGTSAPANIFVGPIITVTATQDGDETAPATPGEFTFSRAKNADDDVVIDYVVLGSATPGADYTALPGTVTIPATQTDVTVAVTVLEEDFPEGPETVVVMIDTISIGMLGAATVATVEITDEDINPALVAWYELDEASGLEADDSSAGDGHAIEYDGATNGFGWEPTSGRIGGAINLDGTSYYVDLTAHLGVFSPLTAGTITGWFNTTMQGPLFSSNETGSDDRVTVEVLVDGRLSVTVMNADVELVNIVSVNQVNDAAWHHFAVTQDGSSGATLYIDGSSVDTTVNVNSADWFASVDGQNSITLGRSERSGADLYFEGFIDDVRIYDVELSGAEVLTLALSAGPAITSHPQSQTIDEPDPATFTVVASGVEPLTYQWYLNGGAVGGETNDTYTIDPTDFDTHDAAEIHCVVTDDNTVSSSSGIAILTINDRIAPTITSPAAPNTIEKLTDYYHQFTATGYPATITWSISGALPNGLTWDAATARITGAPDTVGVSVLITVTASNGVAPAAEEQFTIEVTGLSPSIYDQPDDVTVNEGEIATFTIGATVGGDPLTYQWYLNAAVIPGATETTYTVDPTTGAMDGDEFHCVVTNPEGNVTTTSDIATLTVMVDTPPTITSGMPGDGVEGVLYSHLFTADGYPEPTWSVTAGTLPTGLSLSTGGALTGIPSAVGTYQLGGPCSRPGLHDRHHRRQHRRGVQRGRLPHRRTRQQLLGRDGDGQYLAGRGHVRPRVGGLRHLRRLGDRRRRRL